MDSTTAARVFMGDSLGFHIIFVMFGLTLPILVVWFEWWGAYNKDRKSIDTAKFWSKIMALMVITGVISGTVVALQMSLVWPGILQFGGKVIGLPFMFETYAFLIEAVFLGLYMATWNNNRIPRWLHILFGVMIIVGSTMSAFAITSVNAWMNMPVGFDFIDGQIQNPDVWRAMFSTTSLLEFFHSMPAYYLASSLFIAAIYSIKLLKTRFKERLQKKYAFDIVIIKRLVWFSLGCMVALVFTADLTGKYLAKHEPVKFAAIELVNETDTNLPFVFGGVPGDDGGIRLPYIVIPSALSTLVGDNVDEIKGINEYPEEIRPPSYVRALFNIKLTLIGGLVAVLGLFVILQIFKPNWLVQGLFLVPFIIASFTGLVIMELGWMLTEIGRQPWAVTGYLTVEEAVTKTHDITSFGYIFPSAFLLLMVATIFAIRKIVRDESKRKGAKA